MLVIKVVKKREHDSILPNFLLFVLQYLITSISYGLFVTRTVDRAWYRASSESSTNRWSINLEKPSKLTCLTREPELELPPFKMKILFSDWQALYGMGMGMGGGSNSLGPGQPLGMYAYMWWYMICHQCSFCSKK